MQQQNIFCWQNGPGEDDGEAHDQGEPELYPVVDSLDVSEELVAPECPVLEGRSKDLKEERSQNERTGRNEVRTLNIRYAETRLREISDERERISGIDARKEVEDQMEEVDDDESSERHLPLPRVRGPPEPPDGEESAEVGEACPAASWSSCRRAVQWECTNLTSVWFSLGIQRCSSPSQLTDEARQNSIRHHHIGRQLVESQSASAEGDRKSVV